MNYKKERPSEAGTSKGRNLTRRLCRVCKGQNKASELQVKAYSVRCRVYQCPTPYGNTGVEQW